MASALASVAVKSEHIEQFMSPANPSQTKNNHCEDFTHAAFARDLKRVLNAGFQPCSLSIIDDLLPKSAFQLQIFEQFSPEAALELATCIRSVADIPVTFVVRTDSETYDLTQEAAAFRKVLDVYGRQNVTLGLQCDLSVLGNDATAGLKREMDKVTAALDMSVGAVSIADGPSHAKDWMDDQTILDRVNLNHPSFTNQQDAILQSDATGGWWGPFGPSIAKAQQADKPLIWRSATGQWITPKPMTAYEALWRFGPDRFPTGFFYEKTADGRRFIMGQPGSMVVKQEHRRMYTNGGGKLLPQPPALKKS